MTILTTPIQSDDDIDHISESDNDSVDTEIIDETDGSSSLLQPAFVSKLKLKHVRPDPVVNQSNKQIADQSNTDAAYMFNSAQCKLIDAEKDNIDHDEKADQSNALIDDESDNELNEDVIPESPISPCNRSNRTEVILERQNNINKLAPNNQSINQSSAVASPNVDSFKLKPRTRTIPMKWAIERGCEPVIENSSFILSINPTSSEGRRFIDCQAVFAATNPSSRLINLSNYLSTILMPPWMPLTIAKADDADAALVALTNENCADPINQSINQWIQSVKSNFLNPLQLAFNGTCPLPPAEPVSAANPQDPITIPKASAWSNILTEDSSALIDRYNGGKSATAKQLKLKLCFQNPLVCNLVIAQIKLWHSFKSDKSLSILYDSEISKQLHPSKNDGYQVVVPDYIKNKQTNARSALQYLNQPILTAFDQTDHGFMHVTNRPSLLFNISLSAHAFETRYVICRIEGLAINSTNHPFAATKTTINQSSTITDHDALQSLKQFICYHPSLQTGATSISVPKSTNPKLRKNGVCFVTTPRQNIGKITRLLSFWNANPPENESEAWLANIRIEVSKEGISFCDFCHQPGHRQVSCKMLANGSSALVDSENEQIPLCKRCLTPDIPSHACMLLSGIKCLLCHANGHPSRDCHLGLRSWAHVAGAKTKNKSIKPVKSSAPDQNSVSAPSKFNQPQQVATSIIIQPDVPNDTLAVMKLEFIALQQQMISQMQDQMKQSMLMMQTVLQQTVQAILTAILPVNLSNRQTDQASPAAISQLQHIPPGPPFISMPLMPSQANACLVNQPAVQPLSAAHISGTSINNMPPALAQANSRLLAVSSKSLIDTIASHSMQDVILQLSKSHNIQDIINQLQHMKSGNIHG